MGSALAGVSRLPLVGITARITTQAEPALGRVGRERRISMVLISELTGGERGG